MEVVIKKCHIPILWMDTNVIIDITKHKEGLKLKGIQNERIPKIIDVIHRKTRDRKLIFAQGDQREEIDDLRREAHKAQSSLSLGIQFKHRTMIQDEQLRAAMKCYIYNFNQFELSYKDAFYREPIDELERKSKSKLVVSVFLDADQEEIVERQGVKTNIHQQFEMIRQNVIKDGISFEEQLKKEQAGLLQACQSAVINIENILRDGRIPEQTDINKLSLLTNLMNMWCDLDGGDCEGLYGFLVSDIFKYIPYEEIQSKLHAMILTSEKPIQTGDSMDIQQLSTVLPYCNFIITDRAMRNKIIELGIDKQFETKVFCLSETNDLLNFLEQL